MNTITPSAQTSTAGVHGAPSSDSGEMYPGVPAMISPPPKIVDVLRLPPARALPPPPPCCRARRPARTSRRICALPKSAIFTAIGPLPVRALLSTRMFSGFKSRCTIP